VPPSIAKIAIPEGKGRSNTICIRMQTSAEKPWRLILNMIKMNDEADHLYDPFHFVQLTVLFVCQTWILSCGLMKYRAGV